MASSSPEITVLMEPGITSRLCWLKMRNASFIDGDSFFLPNGYRLTWAEMLAMFQLSTDSSITIRRPPHILNPNQRVLQLFKPENLDGGFGQNPLNNLDAMGMAISQPGRLLL
jgi:hypothetical protein